MENSRFKFRAWDNKQKHMAVQGEPDLETIQSFMFHFGDCKLMQFTGLKDKNGVEIYEGDILIKDNKTYIVQWRNAGFWIKENDKFNNWSKKFVMANYAYEVIGNIYEHEHLL